MRPGTRNTLSLIGLFFAVWVGIRYALPILAPFLLGTALALAAEPMVAFLTKQLHLPRAVGAGLGVTMAFVCIAMLLLVLGAFLVRELGILAGILPNLEDTAMSGISSLQSWLLELAGRMPPGIQSLASDNITALFSDGTSLFNRAIQYVLGLAGSLLSHVPDSALGLGTGIISGYMISAKLPKLRRWITRRLPKEKLKPLLDSLKRMKTAVGSWLTAQLKLAGVTLTVLCLGLLLLRVRYALLWALGITLLDALPVLGTGTVLLPWALICFLQEDTARAIGLLGIYAVISLTRSILEPKLVGRHLGLDPLATLVALYAGYKLWGIGGMILAPLLTVTAMQLAPSRDS
ncbi:MAG: sporulation integral membrane protein YtvI [Oscillospiraceae bacterium]|nr:sporulation integral membrane protein YtvI [Oscillospiraceae bacterium]